MSKYNVVDRAKFTFYQIPKLLIHGEKYRSKITHSEIIAYAILMDRLNVSIKNNWIDDNGDIYFVYSNEELMEILNLSKTTTIKVKKKLKEIGLFDEERTGRANRLYLLEPQANNVEEAKYIMGLDKKKIEDKTIYTQEDKNKLVNNLKSKNDLNHEVQKLDFVVEKLPNQGSSIKSSPAKSNNWTSEVQKLDPSNNNLITNKDNKDNKDNSAIDLTDYRLISHSFKQKGKNDSLENKLIDEYILEQQYYDLYGEELINKMKVYSFNNFQTFVMFTNKLIHAHRSVEKEKGLNLAIYDDAKFSEYTRRQLTRTFNRCIQAERFQKANNIASYLFISFKNVFIDLSEAYKNEINNI